MCKILIIDDEKELVSLLKDSLEYRGYTVFTAFDGNEGIKKAGKQPDLIILDIMMPGIDGFKLCQAIRDEILCPIIFLSAKQSEKDRIKGLALGGDDYITKPFSLNELMARVEAHLRREKRSIFSANKKIILNFKNISIDLSGRQVKINGILVTLTRREFDIIEFLSLHPGQVFSKEQIYQKVWGYDAEGDSNTITEHIKNIRAKFSKLDPDTDYITTVWGIGYRWEKLK